MSEKHKKQTMIKDILKSAGVLDSASLKERVCARSNILVDDYPKATYMKHLKELVESEEVLVQQIDGKYVYSVESDGSDILGNRYIHNRGGKISVPKLVRVAGVSVNEGVASNHSQREVIISFELNHVLISLTVNKDAFPFCLHISRISQSPDKQNIIQEAFGQRVIHLEVPVGKISGFKDKEHSGHLIIKFLNEKEVELVDLGSTNGSAFQEISPKLTSNLLDEALLMDKMTIQTNWASHDKTEVHAPVLPLEAFRARKVKLPALISCSNEFKLLLAA